MFCCVEQCAMYVVYHIIFISHHHYERKIHLDLDNVDHKRHALTSLVHDRIHFIFIFIHLYETRNNLIFFLIF